MAEEKTDLKALMQKLNKQFGAGSIGVASEGESLGTYQRIETGIFAVDHALGGGVPYGAVSLFYGIESSGKSLVLLKTIAGAQKMCRDHVLKMEDTGKTTRRCSMCGHVGDEETCPNKPCADRVMDEVIPHVVCPKCKKYSPAKAFYVDCEGAFTTAWAAKLGCNCDYVVVFRSQTAEDVMNASMVMLESGEIDILAIDTLAQMTPSIEMEENAEKWQQGMAARLINKALRCWVSFMNKSGVDKKRKLTLLLVNQIRFKIGVMFGDPTTRPGGKGQDFATMVELKLWPAGRPDKDDLGNPLAQTFCFKVEKNRTAPTAKTEGNFRMVLRDCTLDDLPRKAGDSDEAKVLFDYARKFNVITKPGDKYIVAGSDATAPTLVAMAEKLRTEPKLLAHVRKTLMPISLGEVWHDLAELEKDRNKKSKT